MFLEKKSIIDSKSGPSEASHQWEQFQHHVFRPQKREIVLRAIQQTRMNWNELKWIQIFRNIDSRMLKWMLFNPEFIYRNCMEHISMPFNLKIILAFSVHCSKFWIGNAVFQSNCVQLNLIKSNWIQLNPKKKYSLFKIRIRIKKNSIHFNPFSFAGYLYESNFELYPANERVSRCVFEHWIGASENKN